LALWTAASGADTTEDRGGVLAETVLVQPAVGRGPCQNEATRRCFHTHDRIFVLTQHSFVATQPASSKPDERVVSAVETRFGWLQLQVPWKYLAENWPVRHVSSSADGSQLAVSGTYGLTLLDTRTKRWRVFGDVSQERELHCVGLAWFRHIVIVYAVMEAAPVEDNIWGDSGRQTQAPATAQLHLYPRKHLDRSSRLLRKFASNLPLRVIYGSVVTDCLRLQPLRRCLVCRGAWTSMSRLACWRRYARTGR